MSFEKAGNFCYTDPAAFFDGTAQSLVAFVDQFGSDGPVSQRKLNRSLKPSLTKVYKNPIAADGTIVRGRPRKEWAAVSTTRQAKTAGKGERSNDDNDQSSKPARLKKGKQRESSVAKDEEEEVKPPPKRPRGRPRKNVAQAALLGEPAETATREPDNPSSPTKTTPDPAPAPKRQTRARASAVSHAEGKNKGPPLDSSTAGTVAENATKQMESREVAKTNSTSSVALASTSRPTPRRRRETNGKKSPGPLAEPNTQAEGVST